MYTNVYYVDRERRKETEKTLSRWVSRYKYDPFLCINIICVYESYIICTRFVSPSHVWRVGWTYCSRPWRQVIVICPSVYVCALARARSFRVCDPGMGPEINESVTRGIPRLRYPPRTYPTYRTKAAPGRVLSLADSPRRIVQYLQCLLVL